LRLACYTLLPQRLKLVRTSSMPVDYYLKIQAAQNNLLKTGMSNSIMKTTTKAKPSDLRNRLQHKTMSFEY